MTNPTPPAPPTSELLGDSSSLLSVQSLIRGVSKNRWLAIVIAGAVLVAAAFYTLGQRRIFQASATIEIDPRPTSPLGSDVQSVVDFGTGFLQNREYFLTQVAIIQSLRGATAVVRDLDLQRNTAFLTNTLGGPNDAPATATVDDAAQILLSRLHVEPVKDSRLVVVSLEDADPERARTVLGHLVDTCVKQNLDMLLDSTTSAVDWLNGQLAKLKDELGHDEQALHDYKTDHQLLDVSIDDQSNMIRTELQQITTTLASAKARRESVAARRKALMEVREDDISNLPAAELLSSPLLQSLRQECNRATEELGALRAAGVLGEKHPQYAAAADKAARARADVLVEVNNIRGSLDSDLHSIDREIAGLSALVEDGKRRGLELGQLEMEYNRLVRSRNDTEKLYTIVQEHTKESDLGRMMRFNNLSVIEPARTTKDPIRPRVPVNLAMGLFGGIILGLAAAVTREVLDRSVKTPEDVERDLGLNFLGLLPAFESLEKRGPQARRRARRGVPQDPASPPELIVDADPTSGIAEAARAIRTNLMFMSPDRPLRRLLVTSSGPSEGKTTVAVSLAIAMAQTGQSVLLLDCDMRRPRIHRIFKQPNDVGITTALMDSTTVDALVRPTGIQNLSILTTGPVPPNPAELLHSAAFEKLVTGLGNRFDRIVIDSPPLGPVTDPAIISTLVDGVLVVIRAFGTSRDAASQGVRHLRDVGANIVGAVLNAVDLGARGGYHYNYYYYRREGYSTQHEPSRGADDATPPAA